MTDFNVRSWALKGAEQRLLEIAAEAKAIYAAFPELRQNDGPKGRVNAGRRSTGRRGGGDDGPTRRRRRRNFSAAERKAISLRMKKYWAARRKQG